MRPSSIFILLLGLVVFTVGCEEAEEQAPEDILSQDEFTAIMIDVQLIEGMKVHRLGPKRNRSPDMEVLYGNVFLKHGIDESDFEKTYDYYKKRPAEMEVIYEQVLDSLSKLDVQVKKEYGKERRRNRDSLTTKFEE